MIPIEFGLQPSKERKTQTQEGDCRGKGWGREEGKGGSRAQHRCEPREGERAGQCTSKEVPGLCQATWGKV